MTIIKETKYICNECGQYSTYQKLIKVLTITMNKKEKRYSHHCPICNSKKFRILSTVISE